MPITHGISPLSISGRCHAIRMPESTTQAPSRPERRSSSGAANAVQPASSPMPTITSITTNAAGTSGQCPSCARVGSGAPSPWLIATFTKCTTIGVSTATAYHFGDAPHERSVRP